MRIVRAKRAVNNVTMSSYERMPGCMLCISAGSHPECVAELVQWGKEVHATPQATTQKWQGHATPQSTTPAPSTQTPLPGQAHVAAVNTVPTLFVNILCADSEQLELFRIPSISRSRLGF